MDWINCPICEIDRTEPFARVQDRLLGIEGEFGLVRCQECGLVYLNPQPSSEEIARYYPLEYDSYLNPNLGRMSWLRRRAIEYGLRKRRNAVTRYKKAGRLLEVGCASGLFLNAMRETGAWEVYGVDISEHAIRFARDQLGLDVFHGQLADAVFPDGFFDVVVLWDVLEHLPNPKQALLEIRRVLRPGGLVIFRVPNLDSLDAKLFGRYWAGLDAPRHFFVFAEATLRRLTESAGFRLIRTTCFSGTYPTFALSVRFWARDYLSQNAQRWVQRLLEAPPTGLLAAPLFSVIDLMKKSSVITVVARAEK